jgi:putative hydrolase of HD superfamily
MKSKDKTSDIVKYLFEAGQLKRVRRSGWWMIGVEHPESIAEHSFRAAIVGYILGKMENADAEKVAMMALFNDLHEARLNDLHKVGHRYINFKKAEKKAFEEQVQRLPKEIADELKSNLSNFQKDSTKEGIIARDADLIECALQAKEYIDKGFKDAKDWLKNIRKHIRTSSAKKLLGKIEKGDSNSWWKGLKKTER